MKTLAQNRCEHSGRRAFSSLLAAKLVLLLLVSFGINRAIAQSTSTPGEYSGGGGSGYRRGSSNNSGAAVPIYNNNAATGAAIDNAANAIGNIISNSIQSNDSGSTSDSPEQSTNSSDSNDSDAQAQQQAAAEARRERAAARARAAAAARRARIIAAQNAETENLADEVSSAEEGLETAADALTSDAQDLMSDNGDSSDSSTTDSDASQPQPTSAQVVQNAALASNSTPDSSDDSSGAQSGSTAQQQTQTPNSPPDEQLVGDSQPTAASNSNGSEQNETAPNSSGPSDVNNSANLADTSPQASGAAIPQTTQTQSGNPTAPAEFSPAPSDGTPPAGLGSVVPPTMQPLNANPNQPAELTPISYNGVAPFQETASVAPSSATSAQPQVEYNSSVDASGNQTTSIGGKIGDVGVSYQTTTNQDGGVQTTTQITGGPVTATGVQNTGADGQQNTTNSVIVNANAGPASVSAGLLSQSHTEQGPDGQPIPVAQWTVQGGAQAGPISVGASASISQPDANLNFGQISITGAIGNSSFQSGYNVGFATSFTNQTLRNNCQEDALAGYVSGGASQQQTLQATNQCAVQYPPSLDNAPSRPAPLPSSANPLAGALQNAFQNGQGWSSVNGTIIDPSGNVITITGTSPANQ